MRIATGGIIHETNTFCKDQTPISDFHELIGAEMIERDTGVHSFGGGIIEACERLGFELVPTYVAWAQPSGTISKAAYAEMLGKLLDGLRNAGELDAVCLTLHGAGVADGEDDIEGDIVEQVRALVGPDTPIVVTLDLHGNMTQRMIDAADACFPVHHYPHIDMYERGQEAIEMVPKLISGELKPTQHLLVMPVIISTTTSTLPPVKDFNELCFSIEERPGVIDCAFCHGFSPADIPVIGVTIMTMTDNDPALAQQIAEEVAAEIWRRREELQPTLRTADEAIQAALAAPGRPVILNEASDNPGGGGPGDGTHLLRAMLDANLTEACFGFMYDPQVAEQAHEAGVGATIEVRLGGRTEELHGPPIVTTAYVKCLTDGKFIQQSALGRGARVELGNMARLVIGGVDVLISSVRTQTLDYEVFLLHGIDIMRYKIVAIKSSAHFRAAFEPVAHRIIQADTPGLSSVNLWDFEYTRLSSVVWPLAPDMSWP